MYGILLSKDIVFKKIDNKMEAELEREIKKYNVS